MQKKQSHKLFKGINRDNAILLQSGEYAFNLKNIRLVTDKDSSRLCIQNETGNQKILLTDTTGVLIEFDVILGVQELNNKIVLICKVNTDNGVKDAIYLITDNPNQAKCLFIGNLNLDNNTLIESIGVYENEDIQKVYWLDGINQPRFINIAKEETIDKSTDPSIYTGFDFVQSPEISYKENGTLKHLDVNIKKVQSGGMFPSGVVQYAISFFNRNGSQTGIIYQSPFLYSTGTNIGLNVETNSSNSFQLTLSNLPSNFEYMRIYRIIYTSINATPSVEIVTDLNTSESSNDIIYAEEPTFDMVIDTITYNMEGSTWSQSILDDDRLVEVKETENGPVLFYVIDNREENNPAYRKNTIIVGTSNNYKYKITIPFNKSVSIQFSSAYTQGYKESGTAKISIAEYSNGSWHRSSNEPLQIYSIKEGSTMFIDNGTTGTTVDPTELLYLGGDPIIAKTMSYKDNTLFLGNLKLNRKTFDKETIDYIVSNSIVYFDYKNVSDDYLESLNTPYYYNFNLDNSNEYFSYFQYGETYRVGVVFLHKTGSWSEVIWLKDWVCDKRVKPNLANSSISEKPILKVSISPYNLEDYIAAKLVCVYPDDNNREVICQGLVLPTLYNLGDRMDNSPYVQSDWFARPEFKDGYSYDTATEFSKMKENKENMKGFPLEYRMWYDSDTYKYPKWPKTGDIVENILYSVPKNSIVGGLPHSDKFNAEVMYSTGQALYLVDKTLSIGEREASIKEYFKYLNYGIDKRILTLHSPELDSSYNDIPFNYTDLKFRVVGYAPLKNNISYVSLESRNNFSPYISGFYNQDLPKDNSKYENREVYLGTNGLVSLPLWVDNIQFENETIPIQGKFSNPRYICMGFPIYPWQKSNSLHNQGNIEGTEYKSVLINKKMSTLRVALSTRFTDSLDMSISQVSLFNSNEVALERINIWGKTLSYYGNIDKVIVTEEAFPRYVSSGFWPSTNVDNISDMLLYTPSGAVAARYNNTFPSQLVKENLVSMYNDYPEGKSITNSWHLLSDAIEDEDGFYFQLNDFPSAMGSRIWDQNEKTTDPISIKYKSTSHAVFALDKDSSGNFVILPKFSSYGTGENYSNGDTGKNIIWQDSNEDFIGFSQSKIPMDPSDENIVESYYVIGEFYRTVYNKFGGDTEEALLSNTWSSCGPIKYFNINSSDTNSIIELEGDIGDTYYMRYDHIKTYPFTREDINQLTDIVSFCVETRINIDGRYDRNRGLEDNTNIDPTNFNLFNPVYSQKDSVLDTYKAIDSERFSLSNFPTQVAWSKTKTNGEEIDSWTNITLSSILDMDGDKGPITSINRYNNDLYVFQPKGIAKLLYNPRVQISASDGVPIEISNSGKVEGKVYITDNHGSNNKWGIAESFNGIYFIDTFTYDACLLANSSITNLSYSKGLHSWFNLQGQGEWNILGGSIRSLYDAKHNEVLFTTGSDCLAFNERLSEFTSFYSYPKVNFMYFLTHSNYQVTSNSLWTMNVEGNYSTMFDNSYSYEISFIDNSDFTSDKVYDTIELRSDDIPKFEGYGKNKTAEYYPFHTLTTENEYQKAISDTKGLKKKFRVWRWQIGRNQHNRDRIRNPWAKFTLTGNYSSSIKLYDIVVNYYV